MSTSLIRQLFPNGNFILSHLNNSVDIQHSIIALLEDLITEKSEEKRKLIVLRSCEMNKQVISETRALFGTLAGNLITPFDREDIFAVAATLKSLSAKTDSLIRYLVQNKCRDNRTGLLILVKSLVYASSELVLVIHGLENLKEPKTTWTNIEPFKSSWGELNNLCEEKLVETLDTIDSVKDILINIDIYGYFAAISLKLKELAETLEEFIVKYA